MRLLLVRHGETAHNAGGITLGRADIPLNELGRLQAQAVARAIRGPIAAVYSSPLSRAFDTATAIARTIDGVSVRHAEPLIEMDVGKVEHLAHDELRERHGDFLRAWTITPGTARMPGGEALYEVQERAWSWVDQARETHTANTIVAVSHNFVILTIACRVLELPLDDFRRLKTSVGGISSIEFGDRGATLVHWNETAHVRDFT